MHRPLHHHLTQARTAGPDHPAWRGALTRAARQARRTRRHLPGHPVHGLMASIACQGGRSS